MQSARNLFLWVCFLTLVLASSVIFQFFGGEVSSVNNHAAAIDPNWFYLRDNRLPTNDERTADILLVGDVMMGRDVVRERSVFRFVAPLLAGANLTVGNLEGSIIKSTGGRDSNADLNPMNPRFLLMPSYTASQLQSAGFDLMVMANNHIYDGGEVGVAETVSRLHSAGIDVIGVGRGIHNDYQEIVRQINGLQVAFLAFNAIATSTNASVENIGSIATWKVSEWDETKALRKVQEIRKTNDLVIVSVHWGYEYELWADPWQRNLARHLVLAGADLVVGHHPHTVQETEVIETPTRIGFVANSLGNFVFDQYDGRTNIGLGLRVFFDQIGLRAVQAIPVMTGLQPRWILSNDPDSLNEAYKDSNMDLQAQFLDRIRPFPKYVQINCDKSQCWVFEDIDQKGGEVEGLFQTGLIDLTGDGLDEEIRIYNTSVMIFQNQALVWENPDSWEVDDLAIGDPNDDGRFELLIAVKKDNANGVSKSHPFIIGYRNGIYKQLWGGSAVHNPIREIELGDVDSDGKQEMVVIEEFDEGLQTVSVWRWHGWGFVLQWRSQKARYANLKIIEWNGRSSIMVGLVW